MATTRGQNKRKEITSEPLKSPPPKRQRQQKQKQKPTQKQPATEPEATPPSQQPRHDTNTNNTPCAFLSLPRELRDEIYKHVLESDRSVSLKQHTFITKTNLASTNRQICEEYLDAVLFCAPIINTTVRNHNFAHVVTFLNRLSEAQLNRLKSGAAAKSRTTQHRKIRITLTYARTKISTKPQLNRWLDRFDDPNRRGAEIEFDYVLDRASWGNGGYKQRAQRRSTAGPGSIEQTRKILVATRGNGHGFW
jgi:hypothetical protein